MTAARVSVETAQLRADNLAQLRARMLERYKVPGLRAWLERIAARMVGR